jgi:hypothetical protein
MPHANRHFLPGYVWHNTRPCLPAIPDNKSFQESSLGSGFRIALGDEIEDIGWRVNLGLNFPGVLPRDLPGHLKLAPFKTFKPFNRPVESRAIFHRARFKPSAERLVQRSAGSDQRNPLI